MANPILSWVGAQSNGVTPNEGDINTTFVFKVKYTGTLPPDADSPRVIITSTGGEVIADMLMTGAGTDYANGVEFSYSTTLSGKGAYSHSFRAEDTGGVVATGLPIQITQGPGILPSIGGRYGKNNDSRIFWLSADKATGLVASSADQSAGIQWNNGTDSVTGATGDGIGAGAGNTVTIVAAQGTTVNYAARICADYVLPAPDADLDAWYLPSKSELNELYLQKDVLNAITGFTDLSAADYWSSTEHDISNAWLEWFDASAQVVLGLKNTLKHVRAICQASFPPSMPWLTSPADNAVNMPTVVDLAYSSVVGSEGNYGAELSLFPDFSDIVETRWEGGGGAFHYANLQNGKDYYWRVKTRNAAGQGGWSMARSFTTIVAAPGAPVLSTPVHLATDVAILTTFTWVAGSGAATHELKIGAIDGFTVDIQSLTGLTGTTVTLTTPLVNGTIYHWKMRAVNAGGVSAWVSA